MTFKTKAQIFGDNGANGLQVPISASNPPGTAAANRGVGFGEGVTSAIANRTTAALAENDEDLNSRLVVLETSGLDGAYRGGAAAIPGIGRTITVDGGAVEAVGDPANTDVVAALLRTTLQSTGDDIGLDVVGPGTGILHRVPKAFSGNTVLPATPIAAVLNPAGAGSTIVEITGPNQFATGGLTELAPYQDLLIISGAGSYSGVYWITAILTDYRVQVAGYLAPVSFPATTAAQVRVERVAFQEQDGGVFVRPGSASAAFEALMPADGTGSFFSGQRLDTAGDAAEVFAVDTYGAVKQVWDNAGLSSLEARTPGKAARRLDARTTATDGRPALLDFVEHPTVDYSTLTPVGSFGCSAEVAELTGTLGAPFYYHLPAAVTLVAGTAKIEFALYLGNVNVAQTALRYLDLIELSGTSGGTYDGTYVVVEKEPHVGNGRATLVRLDGTSPSFAAGSATLQYKPTISATGGVAGFPGGSLAVTQNVKRGRFLAPSLGGLSSNVVHALVGDTLHHGSVIVGRNESWSPEDTANLHGFAPGCVFHSDGNVEVANIYVSDATGSGGRIRATGNIQTDSYISGQQLNLTAAISRVFRAPGVPASSPGWSPLNNQAEAYDCATTGSYIYFDFVIPYGVTITDVKAVVTPGAVRTGTDRMHLAAYASGVDAAGANLFELFPGSDVYDDGTGSFQTMSIPVSGGPASPGTMLRVQVRAGLTAGTDLLSRVYLVGYSNTVY